MPRAACPPSANPLSLAGPRRVRRCIADVRPTLVADEPTGNLDKAAGRSIFELFKKLAAEKGLAIIITTHNTAFGYEADRVITLEDGRIVKEERPHSIA